MKSCMILSIAMLLSSEAGCPVVMTLWVTRSAAEPRLPECLRWGDGRVVRAQGAERAEPRSRIPPALAAQRRGIARYRRNGA